MVMEWLPQRPTINEEVMFLENKQAVWMKVPEAARYFSVPRSRMYEMIHNGDLPAVRLGERSIRVNREEAERFLKENRRVFP